LVSERAYTSGPPGVDLLGALRKKWFVALIPVILLIGAAVALGLTRPVRWKAESTMSVGRIYVNTPAGIPSVLEATQSLASVYSRAIRASPVQEEAARRLAQRGVRASGHLSATPIPDSPLIKISAESSSERAAVALANAGSAALASYVAREARSRGNDTLISEYERATLRYHRLLTAESRLRRRYERDPTPKNRTARDRASAAVDVADVRRSALSTSYQNSVQGEISSPALEVFSRATSAVTDRSSVLQILIFIGVLGGLAAGAAVALLLASRETRSSSPG
jgi:hypothetical protein